MRYSEKEAFNSCPTRYKFQREGLVKIEEGGDANDKQFGAGFHAGLEAHYKGLGMADVEKAFLIHFPVTLKQGESVKTVQNGLECLRQYIAYYKEQDKLWDVLATEELGTIEIGGEEHELHIDLVARHKQSGDVYFWDHKTSTRIPSWKYYEISDQITRYTDYVQKKYGSCAGAIINHVTVDYIEPKELSGKNTYLESLKNPASSYQFSKFEFSKYHKKDMTIVWGFAPKFERQIFNRTKAQIEHWRKSDEAWMKLIGFCEKENVWPSAFGKLCTWCQYYELCLASQDSQIKELLYKTKTEEKKEAVA